MRVQLDGRSLRRASTGAGVVLGSWPLLLVLACSFGAAWGQTPYLVKDINTGVSPQAASNPSSFVAVGGTVLFGASDPVAGGELWTSDGTAAGTKLVKDVYPGDGSSFPSPVTNVNGTLFFAAFGPTANQLWRSDGTPTGTVMIGIANSGSYGSAPGSLTNVAGTLFFVAEDTVNGRELWKTDGTDAGTSLVKDINPGLDGSSPSSLVNVNGTLFFSAFDPIGGTELWKSDGTEAGTVRVADINPGTDSSYPAALFNMNGTLYLSAFDPVHGQELWKSDGTEAGTVLVADITPGPDSSYPTKITNCGGALYFVTIDASTNVAALWKSDGTEAGTVLVKGGYPSAPDSLVSVSGTLFFVALNYSSYTFDLWKSDGTTAGTITVNPGGSWQGPSALTVMNEELYFAAFDPVNGVELWKSDGTEAGTVLVADINPGADSSYPSSIVNAAGTLFFSAADPVHGAELWKSDGSEAGTVLVKDINEGDSSSYFGGGADLNGLLYFGTPFPDPSVNELWRSDGTSAGTSPLGPTSDYNMYNSSPPLNVNGTLFFAALDSTHGVELWKSDGSAGGTVLVKDIAPGADWGNPSSLVDAGGTLFFAATDPDHGQELWKSDGTEAGTVLVKDTYPGPGYGSPSSLTDVNGTLFFLTNYSELWKSDGTEAGTVPVTTSLLITPGLTNVNGTVFFRAYDYNTYAYVLWKSDGTAAGTVPVKAGLVNPLDFTSVNGMLFFTDADEITYVRALWKSDGTEAGTGLVSPGADWNNPSSLSDFNGTLLFSASDAAHGTELWRSDGTAAGTSLVKDIAPGPDSSVPSIMGIAGGAAYLSAYDPVNGRELWKTDGTAAGTTFEADISPGQTGSNPVGLVVSGSKAYFSASNSVAGEPTNRELWAFDVCTGDNCTCVDADGDGYGANGGPNCPAGSEPDCDDHSAAIHPGASDATCDGVDENCDGQVDEGFPGVCQCPSPGPGLVSYWPGDLASVDVAGGHDATLSGGATYAAGQVGEAFSLHGLAAIGGIGTPSTYSFIQNTGVFTIAAWIKLDDPSATLQQAITGNTQTTAERGHFFLWENSDGTRRLRMGVMTGTPGTPEIDAQSGPDAITTSGWHHVAAVGDGAHVTFYVDGVGSAGSGTFGPSSSGDSSHTLSLGDCGETGACPLRGQLDEVQIYDRALGSAAIQALYAFGTHPCHCTDRDGDGYGAEGGLTCPAGAQVDCDDAAASVHPGAPDAICNGIDDNCNGEIDDDAGGACQCSELGGGLVGWWPGDGDAHDIRGGRNGTPENGASFAAGEVGQAFSFDGSDDIVDGIGDPSSFSFIQNTGRFTIEAWIQINDPSAPVEQVITSTALGGGNRGHVFEWDNLGGEQALRLLVSAGIPGSPTILSMSPSQLITTAGWHHVAVTSDGVQVKFFVDGAAHSGSGLIGPLSSGDSSYSLVIGGFPGFYTQGEFGGRIDELRIWNRALGGSEIAAIYDSGGTGPCRCTDADGDGFGSEGGLSCASGTPQDCDDANAAVWRPAPEVTGLRLTDDSATSLTWDDEAAIVGPGVTYDVLRGNVSSPVGSAGDVCQGSAIAITTAVDAAIPPVGSGYRYLVRGHNTCGAGTYGNRSDGTPRVSGTCP